MTDTSPCLAIVGPTGIGKTSLALQLAALYRSELIAVDSMQVYQGMDLGTSKPSSKERQTFVHHGLDLVSPQTSFDIGQYRDKVYPSLLDVLQRSLLPICVGGSGLYFRALLEGLCDAPPQDVQIRERLQAEATSSGTELLYQRLQEVDPKAAQNIHPNNAHRLIRALEVYEATGMPLSSFWEQQAETQAAPCQMLWIGLTAERDWLYERIESRIDAWVAEGWLGECEALLPQGLSETAREALGYKELFAHLQGEMTLEEAIALIKRNTRRYAKRQWTWFNQNDAIHWVDVTALPAEAVAERVGQYLQAQHASVLEAYHV